MVTDSYAAHCLAMLIMFIIACSLSIGWANADGTKPFSDKFELGYIEEYKPQENIIEAVLVDEQDELKLLKRQVEIAKLKKQLHELKNPTPTKAPVEQKIQKASTNNQLFVDCTDALVGLGVPARKAKAEVQNMFDQNPNIKSIQQFITEYGKRCA